MMLTTLLYSLGLLSVVVAHEWGSDDVQEESFDRSRRAEKYRLHLTNPWPKAILPYKITTGAMSAKRDYLRMFAVFEDMSCVRFLPRKKDMSSYGLDPRYYMTMLKRPGACTATSQGYSRWARTNCCTLHNCMHELGHILGFQHEHPNQNRNGWMRVNWNNVAPGDYGVYTKTFSEGWPHDITSVMHYEPWMGAVRGGSMSILFPELPRTLEYYYLFKEIALGYKCGSINQCAGKDFKCENDGFRTVEHGKCQCKCPTGLDPADFCRTPLKEVTNVSWPKGKYALPQMKEGCPKGGSFQNGQILFSGIDGFSKPKTSHVKGDMNGEQADLNFCTRNVDDYEFDSVDAEKFNWPVGLFCIYMKGDKCPREFTSSSFEYKVTSSVTNGQVPEGTYTNTKVKVNICCQFRGFHVDPVLFPTEMSFSLIQYEETCQEVTGMHWEKDSYTITNSDGFQTDSTTKKWLDKSGKSLTVPLCNYRKADMKCGGSITLSKTNPMATIEIDSKGRNDMECTWVIRGVGEDTALVLDFDKLNVKKDGKNCHDTIEVRHAKIGQYGLKYCGAGLDHSIRSITNKLLVRFITYGESDSSFKATIRATADEDMCYDVRGYRPGNDYDGSVNYTRLFEPCLPWASVPECYHNPFLRHDVFAGLDGNACRNPDRSFRPWCYTDRVGCKRNYCDVCGLEVPHDKVDYCDKLKDVGFCTRDAAMAVKYCPKTCLHLLPTSKTPLKKYHEISCEKPTPPAERVIVGDTKSSYKLGETVQYKCKKTEQIVSSTCMTSGHWTEVGCETRICPAGFVPFEGTCYKYMYEGKSYTLKDATELCKSLGAQIVLPRSLKEDNFIRSLTMRTDCWIGVTDIEVEGQWRDMNGSLVSWTNWNRGEPNNHGSGEDCTVMQGGGGWNDFPCSLNSAVVCTLPGRKLPEQECEDVLGSKCQRLLTDRPTMCEDLPTFVNEFCRKTCRVCPGFDAKCSVQNTNPNVLTLTTQTTISVGESVNYKCERFSYPTKGSKQQACLSNGKLSGEPLECEQCPFGFKMANNACHGLIAGRNFSYKDAQKECSKLDGFLAMPKTEAENHVVSSLGLGQTIWIGASDHDDEGSFIWDDKSTITWENWGQGEPKASGRRHDCVVMNSDKTWTNVRCGDMDLITVCTIPKSGSHVCWDRKDLGATYDGKVNITVKNQRCGSWAELNCPKSPLKKGYERFNLESNYCRNPDEEDEGPWCYTGHGCRWEFCNVCGEESKYIADIKCGAPTVPSDGKIVGVPRESYKIGDVVTIQCKRNKFLATTTCLTSGNWSPMGTACTECPIGYSPYLNTCYGYIGKELNYDDAVKECSKNGGHLPRPKTIEENDFIKNMNHWHYTWFDARKNPTDDDQVFKWSDGTKVTWLSGSQPFYECGYIDEYGTWSSTKCDFIHPKQGLICAVQKLDNPECRDFLEGQCLKWMHERPTMCRDHTKFSKEFCINTCGHCQNAAHCKVPSAKRYAFLVTKKSTIKTGDFVEYKCRKGTYAIDGNKERACFPNGQLSGSDLICGETPPGYKKYKGVNYGLVNKNLKFSEAATECEKVNGYIASPKNEAENNFISSLRGGYVIWLGASDAKVEGTFVWQDGSKVEWSNWDRGEPNDWRRMEDCSVMLSDKTWNDRSCYTRKRVVCASIPLGIENCYDADDQGASYDGKVGVSQNGKVCVPWAKVSHCRHNPFQKGDEQMNLVENYCRNPDKSLSPWCYTDADNCKKHYCNVCDHEQEKDVSKVRCPKPNIPSDGVIHDNVKSEYKVGEKVKIHCKGSKVTGAVTTCLTSGHWSPVGQACSVCPSGNDYFRNKCYAFVDKKLSYIDALKYCKEDAGGFLASPKSPMENDFIARMRNGKAVWIGINDIETEGRWKREDGGDVTWTNWGPGEPNNWDGNEDCVVMKSKTNIWYDRSQKRTEAFVCQKQARNENSPLCEDLLQSQCPKLVAKEPNMCKKHNNFALQYCAKTCDMCHLKNLQSNDQVIVGYSDTFERGTYWTPPLMVFFGTSYQYLVGHAGKIVAWEYNARNSRKTAFQVWRKTSKRNVYRLVGQNIFTTGSDKSQQRYDVPEGSQIQVKKGDYIGICIGENGGIRHVTCNGHEDPELQASFKSSKKVSSLQDLKVDGDMKFSEKGDCLSFPFRAIIEI